MKNYFERTYHLTAKCVDVCAAEPAQEPGDCVAANCENGHALLAKLSPIGGYSALTVSGMGASRASRALLSVLRLCRAEVVFCAGCDTVFTAVVKKS